MNAINIAACRASYGAAVVALLLSLHGCASQDTQEGSEQARRDRASDECRSTATRTVVCAPNRSDEGTVNVNAGRMQTN